jgi:hypothetical protein
VRDAVGGGADQVVSEQVAAVAEGDQVVAGGGCGLGDHLGRVLRAYLDLDVDSGLLGLGRDVAFLLLHHPRNVLRESLRKRRVEDAARRRLGMPRLLARDAALDAIHGRRSLSESERRALASLPERDRELLQLRVIEERPYRDIAVRLRCTPQAARHRVSRLLRELQCTLGGQQP